MSSMWGRFHALFAHRGEDVDELHHQTGRVLGEPAHVHARIGATAAAFQNFGDDRLLPVGVGGHALELFGQSGHRLVEEIGHAPHFFVGTGALDLQDRLDRPQHRLVLRNGGRYRGGRRRHRLGGGLGPAVAPQHEQGHGQQPFHDPAQRIRGTDEFDEQQPQCRTKRDEMSLHCSVPFRRWQTVADTGGGVPWVTGPVFMPL
jgi:hypothetical protein